MKVELSKLPQRCNFIYQGKAFSTDSQITSEAGTLSCYDDYVIVRQLPASAIVEPSTVFCGGRKITYEEYNMRYPV